MVPTLLYLILRKIRRTNPSLAFYIESQVRKIGKVLFLVMLMLIIIPVAFSQSSKLEYAIYRKGRHVGDVHVSSVNYGNRHLLKMESLVDVRMILRFIAKTKEEALFENGVMIRSSIYRKMNGREKANTRIHLSGNKYIVTQDAGSKVIRNTQILYNMLCLYVQEPLDVKKVFSDNFQQLLDIENPEPHHYKIHFPDGTHNEYFFRNGICQKIQIHNTLYSVTIILKS